MSSQDQVLSEIKQEFCSFLDFYDYERASDHFDLRILPLLAQVHEDSTRNALHFDFSEHLHDLSVLHQAGCA